MLNISEKIKEYMQHPAYPFHMPGHKRCEEQHDFTEIDGFDVLSHPEGIIAESQRRAAGLFGADRTYYLVNGSTAGILAGILAASDKDKKVLVGPDCHKSVYHALELGRLTAVDADGQYLYKGDGRITAVNNDDGADVEESKSLSNAKTLVSLEDIGRKLDWEILPERIERTLEAGNGKAGSIGLVVVTSPSYEGVVSDIARIAEIAHSHGALLLVDEAHGSHLGMHPAFPENSNRLGADLVVHSMHKTMSALTQTALLHVNTSGHALLAGREDEAERLSSRIEHFLEMLQTSSPSYLLMESMDLCVDLLTKEKEALFEAYADRLERFRAQIGGLTYIDLFETEHSDPGKLVFTVKQNPAGLTAPQLYACLRDRFDIQLEFAQENYALAMTSFADTDEAFAGLFEACAKIDAAAGAGRIPGGKEGVRPTDRGTKACVNKTDCYEGSH